MDARGREAVTVAEAAAIIGVSPRRVRAYIAAGQLAATLMTARLYLVPRAAAENFRRGKPGRKRIRATEKKPRRKK
jgi:excisionase family DNA binding protein